jgi:hypothetical protein
MIEERWVIGFKQRGRDWFWSWRCIMRVWCFVGIYKLYTFYQFHVGTFILVFVFFLLYRMNKKEIGFSSPYY